MYLNLEIQADLLHFYPQWDALIKEKAPLVLQVNQPLLPLIEHEVWKEFIAAVENPEKMRSLLECYYHRPEFDTSSEILKNQNMGII